MSNRTCFLVTKGEDSNYIGGTYSDKFDKVKSEQIVRLLIFPEECADPKDFVLNSKCSVYNHNLVTENKEKNLIEGTLGSLASWAVDQFKFESIDKLKTQTQVNHRT